MFKSFTFLATLGFLVMGLVSGVSAETYEAGGHQYWLSCNRNGYALESEREVTRRGRTGIETLYLGRGCDTLVKGLGKGSWCWSNVGFFATVRHSRSGRKYRFDFDNQELMCRGNEDDRFAGNCRC